MLDLYLTNQLSTYIPSYVVYFRIHFLPFFLSDYHSLFLFLFFCFLPCSVSVHKCTSYVGRRRSSWKSITLTRAIKTVYDTLFCRGAIEHLVEVTTASCKCVSSPKSLNSSQHVCRCRKVFRAGSGLDLHQLDSHRKENVHWKQVTARTFINNFRCLLMSWSF